LDARYLYSAIFAILIAWRTLLSEIRFIAVLSAVNTLLVMVCSSRHQSRLCSLPLINELME